MKNKNKKVTEKFGNINNSFYICSIIKKTNNMKIYINQKVLFKNCVDSATVLSFVNDNKVRLMYLGKEIIKKIDSLQPIISKTFYEDEQEQAAKNAVYNDGDVAFSIVTQNGGEIYIWKNSKIIKKQ